MERSLVERALPTNMDWARAMRPVENQGKCGSCWAFSAVSAIEGTQNILIILEMTRFARQFSVLNLFQSLKFSVIALSYVSPLQVITTLLLVIRTS